MTKDAAKRSPSALLRPVSMSNGRWTFYEAVISGIKEEQGLDIKKLQHLRDKQLDELKDLITAFMELTERTSFMCEPDKQSCLDIDCPFRLVKDGHRHYLCLQLEDLMYTLDS